MTLRYALRQVFRRPGFSLAVITALALGIGVNTTIFRFVDGLLFRPLPVEDLDRVVRVMAVNPDRDPNDYFGSSYPVFTDYRDGATSFSALAAYDDQLPIDASRPGGDPERLTGAIVTGRYFDVLRTRPWRGRLIAAHDDGAPGGHAVTVISYGLWQRLFGGDDAVIGQTLSINRRPYTVIGVTPPGVIGVSLDSLPDLWVPMAMANEAMPAMARAFPPLQTRNFYWVSTVGRLKPGVSIAQAQAELDVIASRRAAPEPKNDREPFARVVPAAAMLAQTVETTRYQQMSWILMGVVVLILAIACADAAGLLLVRADGRRREIAVRLAIGATRSHIVRQLLVESLLLAGLAAAAGLILSAWSSSALLALLPSDFPLAPTADGPIADPRVLAFTVIVSMVAGIAFGIAPAWRASRPDLVPALKQEAATVGRVRRISLGHVLVVGQVALSVLLLVGAGLLIRTVSAFARVAPGFSHRSVLVASVDVSLQGYDDERGRQYFETLQQRIAMVPGVTEVGLGRMVPVESSGMRVTFNVPGEPRRRGADAPEADYNPVTPGFFRTLGVSIVEGRGFTAADTRTGAPVVVVNRALAARYFPHGAVGQHLDNFGPPGTAPEIVGIAGDVRYRALRDSAAPMIYVPLSQAWMPRMSLLVETSVPPATMVRDITAAAAQLDAGVPLFHVQTIDERMKASIAVERLLAWLLASFSALAVFLAAAGLYGVMASATAARTREFGIRLALGATARQVRRMVLMTSLLVIGTGFVLGTALAAGLARGLDTLLFGVGPLDAATYAGVGVLLGVIGSVASLWPARRAARTEPSVVLRYE